MKLDNLIFFFLDGKQCDSASGWLQIGLHQRKIFLKKQQTHGLPGYLNEIYCERKEQKL